MAASRTLLEDDTDKIYCLWITNILIGYCCPAGNGTEQEIVSPLDDNVPVQRAIVQAGGAETS